MSITQRNFFISSLTLLVALSILPLLAGALERPERAERPDLRVFNNLVVPEAPTALYRGGEIIVKMEGAERFRRVRGTAAETVPELLATYRARGDVLYAEPNYLAHAFFVPNDQYYNYQWHFDNAVYGGVHAEDAWDVSTGSGVIVAVIDTGVAYENYVQGSRRYYQAPDLAGTSFVAGYDFVNNDTHPNDDQGHGTHVTGTIAQSTNNSAGVAGLAYGASIMPIKALNSRGSGSYADIADGVRYAADNGASVINLSLGGSATATYLEEALAYAYNKGVTIVAASGNGGAGSVSYPAAYDDYVIAVGATRFDEARASYSNYGSSLDIVAPGGDTSVDQNGDGYRDGVLQQTFSSRRYGDFGYYFYQGTSMATPHVAAAAALVLANGNATTPDGVRSALEGSADDLGAAGRDNLYGHGLLNAAAALGVVPTPPPPPEPVDTFPIVVLTAPSEGLIVSGLISLTATSSDDVGVTEVSFSVDGSSVGTDATAPYEILWDTTLVSDGNHTIMAIATDTAGQESNDEVSVVVENVNEAPSITTSPVTSATEGTLYQYDVDATDPDAGDALTYMLSVNPSGMSIDEGTGLIEWTPSGAQLGDNAVTVTATDTLGLSDEQSFTVAVSELPPLPSEIVVFTDSFEDGFTKWTEGPQSDWHTSGQRATDGSRSAEVDGSTVNGLLVSDLIDLGGKTNATVTFSWLIERGLDSGEYLAFDVSTDNGATWVEKGRLRGNNDQENTWHDASIIVNDTTELTLRFRATMSRRNEDANVDNVVVTAF